MDPWVKWLEEAINCDQDGKIDQSLYYYERVFSVMPSSDIAIEIAIKYDELENKEEAKRFYTKALELDANSERAYYGLATLLEDEGRIDEAMAYYREAIDLNSDYVHAHFFLANLYDQEDQVDLAIYHYERVLALDSEHFYAHLNLGSILESKNRDLDALELFNAAEAIDRSNHLLYFNFGVVYKKLGNIKKARECYHKSLELSTSYPYTYLNLALLYKDYFKDFHQSLKIYSEGIHQHREMAVLYYNRGCVYAILEMNDLAIEDLKRALQLDNRLYDDLIHDPELQAISDFFKKLSP